MMLALIYNEMVTYTEMQILVIYCFTPEGSSFPKFYDFQVINSNLLFALHYLCLLFHWITVPSAIVIILLRADHFIHLNIVMGSR